MAPMPRRLTSSAYNGVENLYARLSLILENGLDRFSGMLGILPGCIARATWSMPTKSQKSAHLMRDAADVWTHGSCNSTSSWKTQAVVNQGAARISVLNSLNSFCFWICVVNVAAVCTTWEMRGFEKGRWMIVWLAVE